MNPDRIPPLVEHIAELRADVDGITALLRDARERIAGIRGEMRLVIALLVANGLLNFISVIRPHP